VADLKTQSPRHSAQDRHAREEKRRGGEKEVRREKMKTILINIATVAQAQRDRQTRKGKGKTEQREKG